LQHLHGSFPPSLGSYDGCLYTWRILAGRYFSRCEWPQALPVTHHFREQECALERPSRLVLAFAGAQTDSNLTA